MYWVMAALIAFVSGSDAAYGPAYVILLNHKENEKLHFVLSQYID